MASVTACPGFEGLQEELDGTAGGGLPEVA
jgi:hypothetical protein